MTADREAQVKALADLIAEERDKYPRRADDMDSEDLARAILAAQPDHSALVAELRWLAERILPPRNQRAMTMAADALEGQTVSPPAPASSMRRDEFLDAIRAERERQAIEYAYRGDPVKSAALIQAALDLAPPPADLQVQAELGADRELPAHHEFGAMDLDPSTCSVCEKPKAEHDPPPAPSTVEDVPPLAAVARLAGQHAVQRLLEASKGKSVRETVTIPANTAHLVLAHVAALTTYPPALTTRDAVREALVDTVGARFVTSATFLDHVTDVVMRVVREEQPAVSRDELIAMLSNLPSGVEVDGQDVPLLSGLPRGGEYSAIEYLADAIRHYYDLREKVSAS